ncbi:MAG: hypothetical protein IKC49_03110, partial [Clostridia bacterium]|nr:hypothetical protein [Clostridia bacterium]
VTFIATGVKYEGEFRNIKYNGTSILPQTMNVEGVNYRLYGFATDPDSTTLYSSDYFTFNFEIEENGIYYAVYQASYPATGYVTSAWLESKMEIKVNVLGKVNQYDANYKKISTYTSFDTTLGTSITQSQVTFEFKGWAVDPDSTEYHDIEYIQENDIAEVYAVYERSDTSELITVNEFSELMKYYVSNISVYDSTSYNGSKSYYTVYLLEGYQKDVTINDTTYEFAGWSTSSTSTELVEVDLSTSNYMSPLYAVYKCDEEYYTISGLKTVSEMVNKVNVVTFNEETVVEYDNLADFEMLVDILGIPFEFNGWALDPDSTDVVDSTYVTENKIRSVYAVYMNMETAELMTVQGLKDFEASQYVSMVHTFEGDLENVNPVDFEYGVDVNGTYYEFYGWASEPTTELIEADLYEYDELYAIYANPETGELISVVDLQAL